MPKSPLARFPNWNVINQRPLTVRKSRVNTKTYFILFHYLLLCYAYSTLATYADVAFLEAMCFRRRCVHGRQFSWPLSCCRRLFDVLLAAVALPSKHSRLMYWWLFLASWSHHGVVLIALKRLLWLVHQQSFCWWDNIWFLLSCSKSYLRCNEIALLCA